MIGTTIERYHVEAELGAGGMATVYRVRHVTLGSLHALKVLNVQNALIQQRLVQEGRMQARLRHPNIVAVTDVIDVDGSPGLVMEYIEGPSLEAWLAANRPSLAQAEAIFQGILLGVGRAHRHGFVHRDLKPGNVLLDDIDGMMIPMVADFGVAKVLDEEVGPGPRTRSGVAMGTPGFMAPEQVRNAKGVDQRADIFALGCILYELVSGERPFQRADVLDTMTAVCGGVYAPLGGHVPERIRSTIAGCLVVDRDQRIADCAGVLQALAGGVRLEAPLLAEELHVAALGAGLQHEAPAMSARRPSSSAPAVPAARIQTWARSGERLGADSMGDGSVAAGRRPSSWGWVVGITGVLVAAALLVVVVVVVVWAASRFGAASLSGTDPAVEQPMALPEDAATGSAEELGPATAPAAGALPLAAKPAVGATEAVKEPLPPAMPPARPEPANPPRASGTLTVVGDAVKVRLVGEAGSFSAGAVPAGEYTIRTQFAGQKTASAGTVTVFAGEDVTISCNQEFQMCRVQ